MELFLYRDDLIFACNKFTLKKQTCQKAVTQASLATMSLGEKKEFVVEKNYFFVQNECIPTQNKF